jgi:dTDP-4-dehydrorhamnose reductase
MRYVILGGLGMLGRDLTRALEGRDVVALGRAELDVTDAEAVRDAVAGAGVVINSAAFTKVDDAEADEATALAINAVGAGNAAAGAAAAGAGFVQVSTDYVFSGADSEPYDEDAPLRPIGAYGRSKAEGERLVRAAHPSPFIVRTAWLYGQHGACFPRTMLRLAEERDTVEVITDQLGQPTWSLDLARAIVALLDSGTTPGIFHGTNSGQTTWFDLAREVFRLAGLDPERVLPTTSASFVRPAPRPAYSVLGHGAWGRAGLPEPRPWHDALADAFDQGALTT